MTFAICILISTPLSDFKLWHYKLGMIYQTKFLTKACNVGKAFDTVWDLARYQYHWNLRVLRVQNNPVLGSTLIVILKTKIKSPHFIHLTTCTINKLRIFLISEPGVLSPRTIDGFSGSPEQYRQSQLSDNSLKKALNFIRKCIRKKVNKI